MWQPRTMGLLWWLGLGSALSLALVHLFAGKLRFLDARPRSIWLSGAGGASVAYVLLHLLPELREAQSALSDALVIRSFERHVYVVSLTGLVVFYGLERSAKISRSKNRSNRGADETSPDVFWIHTASFAVYNFLIGYLLLHREVRGLGSLLLYAVAMMLHFVVNDYGLRQDHKSAYVVYGRWLLAAGVLGGWAIGASTTISGSALAVIIAFLSGGVILNVLKEELPEERESRFWPFFLGAAGYAAVLVSF